MIIKVNCCNFVFSHVFRAREGNYLGWRASYRVLMSCCGPRGCWPGLVWWRGWCWSGLLPQPHCAPGHGGTGCMYHIIGYPHACSRQGWETHYGLGKIPWQTRSSLRDKINFAHPWFWVACFHWLNISKAKWKQSCLIFIYFCLFTYYFALI